MYGKRYRKRGFKPSRGNAEKDNEAKAQKLDRRFEARKSYKVKPEPFPRSLYLPVKYFATGSIATTVADTANSYTFRLNNCYDPHVGVNGTTCVGWSQLTALYDRYQVLGAKLVVNFTSATQNGTRCGVRLRVGAMNSTSGQNLKQLGEQPMTYISELATQGKNKKYFSFFIRPWTLMGVSKLEYMANSSKYCQTMSSLPPTDGDECWVDIFSVNKYVASTSVAFDVKIKYYIRLYDRIPLVSSGTPI